MVKKSKPFFKEIAFSAIQVINPSIFKHIEEKGSFSLIDLYLRLAEKFKINSYNQNNSFWIDLGKKENHVIAEKWISENIL